MNLLTIENMSKSYTERMLFSHINLGINEGDKIGVIGINGTGKSTLLKIIAGLEEPDEGSLTRGKKVRIEYLAQTPSFDDSKTLLENVIHEKKAEEEYRNLEGEVVRAYVFSCVDAYRIVGLARLEQVEVGAVIVVVVLDPDGVRLCAPGVEFHLEPAVLYGHDLGLGVVCLLDGGILEDVFASADGRR